MLKNGIWLLIQVIKAANAIANKAPRNKAEIALRKSVVFPVMDASPIPIRGDIKGATNMAPMITAGEFVISPNVAMLHDRITSRKKSYPLDADEATSSLISCRFWGGKGLMRVLNQLAGFSIGFS